MTPVSSNRNRLIACGWILLIAQLAVLAILALRSHGVIGPGADNSSTDYMMIYASGKLAQFGTPSLVYDLARQAELQRQLFGGPLTGFFPFYYPPVYLIVCDALAHLPYLASFAVWVIVTGGIFVASLRAVTHDWRVAIALCSFPSAIVNLGLGQNAFVTASLLTFGALLIDGSPVVAGLAFGLLVFKPHFLIVVPLALLIGRRWRAFGALMVSIAVLLVVSVAFFGIETWRSFIEHIPVAQAIYGSGQLGYWAQTSVFAAVRLLGGGNLLAAAIHAAAMAVAIATTLYAWWKDAPQSLRAISLIGATLVCVPVNLSYDLLAAAGAVAFMCRDDFVPSLRPWEIVLIVGDWLIAFAGRGIAENYGVPLLPLIALSLLAIAISRLRLATPTVRSSPAGIARSATMKAG